MEYIYDIVLNFQDKYYEFYEWYPKDKIINIKKIPIYKITTKDYLNIKKNLVIIDRNTLPKKSKIFLLTNSIEVIGILLDKYGKIIKISSLLFDEADDILKDKDEIKLIDIKYRILKRRHQKLISRQNQEKQNYINKYLKSLDLSKDEYLIKYLYYDIYGLEEENINTAYNKLLVLSKENYYLLYDHIQKIKFELKK